MDPADAHVHKNRDRLIRARAAVLNDSRPTVRGRGSLSEVKVPLRTFSGKQTNFRPFTFRVSHQITLCPRAPTNMSETFQKRKGELHFAFSEPELLKIKINIDVGVFCSPERCLQVFLRASCDLTGEILFRSFSFT